MSFLFQLLLSINFFIFLNCNDLLGDVVFSGAFYVTHSDSMTIKAPLGIDSKGGTSYANAYNVYVPVNSEANNITRVKYNRIGQLPNYDTKLTLEASVSYSGEKKNYYQVAIQSSGNNYFVITDPQSVEAENSISFSIYDITYQNSDYKIDLNVSANPNFRQNQYIYIFMTDSGKRGETIDITETQSVDGKDEPKYPGLYFQLFFSSQYDATNYPVIDPSTVRPGDGHVSFNYGYLNLADEIKNYYFRTLTINYGAQAQTENFNYSEVMANNGVVKEFMENGSGVASIYNLQNGVTQNVAVAIENKFQFVSKASASVAATPQEIEVFLDSQSCYLISAGFQKNHYVLDYFRYIRDQYLFPNYFGKKFVLWYYKWSPQVAYKIVKSKFWSATTRSIAYLLYYFIKCFLYIVFLFTLFYVLYRIYSFKRKSWPAIVSGKIFNIVKGPKMPKKARPLLK